MRAVFNTPLLSTDEDFTTITCSVPSYWTVERIVDDNGVELQIIKKGFVLDLDEKDPFQTAMLRLLGVFVELVVRLISP